MDFVENQVYTAMCGDAESGAQWKIDMIFEQGCLWLVPKWIEDHARKIRYPERRILLSGHRYQVLKEGHWMGHVLVNEPIPMRALCDLTQSGTHNGFEVFVDTLSGPLPFHEA